MPLPAADDGAPSSLAVADIAPGIVAYFDHRALIDDSTIDSQDDGLNRDGPFLCIQVIDGRSVWLALTTQFRIERLQIEVAWRLDGGQKWRCEDVYVADALSTFVGPNEAFVRAAANELAFSPNTRPRVTHDAVDAALAEVRTQGGPLLD